MTTEQIAAIYMDLPEEKQEKFVTFLNQLLSEAQADKQPLPFAADPANC